MVAGLFEQLLLPDQTNDLKVVNAEAGVLPQDIWLLLEKAHDLGEFNVGVHEEFMLVVFASIVVLEQWLDTSPGQLLVDAPSNSADQFCNLLVKL